MSRRTEYPDVDGFSAILGSIGLCGYVAFEGER